MLAFGRTRSAESLDGRVMESPRSTAATGSNTAATEVKPTDPLGGRSYNGERPGSSPQLKPAREQLLPSVKHEYPPQVLDRQLQVSGPQNACVHARALRSAKTVTPDKIPTNAKEHQIIFI